MRFSLGFICVLTAVLAALAAFTLWPAWDLAISDLFAARGEGFFWRDNPVLNGLGKIAFYGARGLAVLFAVCAATAWVRRRTIATLPAKAWLFLLLALLIGPGLLANVVFKDHWGRARPRDVVVYGGTKTFTPALHFSDQCHRNCSFVSGDGSFGFFLPALAYVVPRRRSRLFFGLGLALGGLFGGARILLGAHFASDVLYAAFLSLASGAGLHALMYGRAATRALWRSWFKTRLVRPPVASAAS